jgi:hypothetical protein
MALFGKMETAGFFRHFGGIRTPGLCCGLRMHKIQLMAMPDPVSSSPGTIDGIRTRGHGTAAMVSAG